MTTTAVHDARAAQSIARSVLYTFLARALAFPTDDRLREHRDLAAPVLTSLAADDPRLGPRITEVLTALSAPAEDLRRAHTATFPPIDSTDHPPYEAAYASGDIFVQTDVMADVAAFGRAHGVRAGGEEPARPDHICAELELMGFLAHKEAVALRQLGPGQVAECRRTQRTFLHDHLGRWGPAFGRRLALYGPAAAYCAIGHLLAVWIELDCEALGVTDIEPLEEPHPVPPPDDGACGWDAPAAPTGADPGGDVAGAPVTIRPSARRSDP